MIIPCFDLPSLFPSPRARLWDPATGINTAVLTGHTGAVTGAAFRPDGQQVASCSGNGDCSVRLWDVKAGECTAELKGHERHIGVVVYSSDGATLASGDNIGTILLWDPSSTGGHAPVAPLAKMKAAHTEGITGLAWMPDGRLASCSWDGCVKVGWAPCGSAARHDSPSTTGMGLLRMDGTAAAGMACAKDEEGEVA